MKVRSSINIHAKSQVDRSMHNKNYGEGSNEAINYVWPKDLRLEGLIEALIIHWPVVVEWALVEEK